MTAVPEPSVASWPQEAEPQNPPDRSLPRPVLLAMLVTGAVALALSLATPFGAPKAWALPAFAAGIAVAELAVVQFQVGRQRWGISCSDAVLALVFALAPGSWMVLSVAAGVAAAKLLRRQSAPKIVFNVLAHAAATAAGVLVATQAHGNGLPTLTAAALAVLAVWAVQTLAVSVVVSATGERRLLPLLLTSAPPALVHSAASASVGLLAAWLAVTAPAGLIGLLVPVVLLWSSFDQTSRRSAEARMFAELARGQEQAGGGSVDLSAQVVVTTAARLLGGADVSLLLFATDGLVRYQGDEGGRPARTRVPLTAMQEPWIPEVLSGGVVLGSVAGAPYCGMRVGPPERPLALLYAVRESGTGAFSRRDASLARVLVGQAETWLSVADLAASRDAALDRAEAADSAARALGDLGAHTAPTLLALRESASRLARLAGDAGGEAMPESVTDIVEELHTAEQAVASLLGAIALAAESDLAGGADEMDQAWPQHPHPVVLGATPYPPPTRSDEDWTSTGVLS